ncbi:Ig-like domain-containing protein [uncultured Paraglaciecola sp.]|uniref:Ig-like domain-containing protein n=1 Tax=uncultured Paraglaciecola sp. TaxID=1765024 RepID=UPI0030DB401C|tara:strand:- start:24375 stop:24878 length:504 start_codon:yes stop_codon:yes gene_type:complete
MKTFLLKTSAAVVMASALAACNDNDHEPYKVNSPPTANSTSLTTQTNTSIMESVTGNDSDGDMLTYAIVTAPTSGSLNFDASGSFTYQPPQDQTGIDSFEFSVSDGVNEAVVATVEITIETLAVSFGDYSRQAFNQLPADKPLSLKGRTFIQDVEDEAAYDDLLMDN